MTPNCGQCTNSVERVLPKQGEKYAPLRSIPLWLHRHRTGSSPAKTHICATNCASLWGIKGMVGLSIDVAKKYLIAFAAVIAVTLAAAAFSLRGSSLESARDFEECVEAITANQSSSPLGDERDAAMTGCNARFAGRRKPGGGYSYYDFMQGRSFDIAGPNPTADERTQIDREYIAFLDAQRREAASAELAKKQDEQLRADLEIAHQPAGPPLVLTPKNPSFRPQKRPADRPKSGHCDDNSLVCGWSKLSAVVKDAFASSSRTKP
jgi:hypothetical protein